MGLNIVATRKVSLKGFAEGWDECFLLVRSANEAKRKEWQTAMNAVKENEDESDAVVDVLRQAATEAITGGQVIDTDENGQGRKATLTPADVPTVIEELNIYWLQEVVAVATGADRLKALI